MSSQFNTLFDFNVVSLFFAQFRMPRVVVDESWCIDHTEVVEGPMVYILSFDMIF
jgi:hypothetical protein